MATFDVFNPLQNVTPKFTEEQLATIMEWFDETAKPVLTINNEEPIQVISIENLIEFLDLKKFHKRGFHYPTYATIMNETENLKAADLRLLTKDQVIYMLNNWIIENKLKHELTLAFRVFDTENRNFLDVDEIQSIVMQLGDTFSEEETRELLRDANVRGDGNVYYEDFIESMFSMAPELNDVKTEYLYDNPDEDPSVPPEPVEEPPEPLPELPPPPPVPTKKGKRKK